MLISGLNQRGAGVITANTESTTVTGTLTTFSTDMRVGTTLVNQNNEDLGTVANIVSDTELVLSANSTANVSANAYNYITNVTVPNTTVVSTDGITLLANDLITGNIGDKIVFSEITYEYGVNEPWRNLINVYGNLVNGTSQVRLELADSTEVVGTVAYNPADDTSLLYTVDVDTIPANTLSPINAIIDPQTSRPNRDLQNLVNGTRYLLVNDYSSPANVANAPTYNWIGADNTRLEASANDIIQYNGQHWVVIFDASDSPDTYYVTNMTTGTQYVWNGNAWAKSYEGFYEAGKWQLVI
jgi:hypothetical protein